MKKKAKPQQRRRNVKQQTEAIQIAKEAETEKLLKQGSDIEQEALTKRERYMLTEKRKKELINEYNRLFKLFYKALLLSAALSMKRNMLNVAHPKQSKLVNLTLRPAYRQILKEETKKLADAIVTPEDLVAMEKRERRAINALVKHQKQMPEKTPVEKAFIIAFQEGLTSNHRFIDYIMNTRSATAIGIKKQKDLKKARDAKNKATARRLTDRNTKIINEATGYLKKADTPTKAKTNNHIYLWLQRHFKDETAVDDNCCTVKLHIGRKQIGNILASVFEKHGIH